MFDEPGFLGVADPDDVAPLLSTFVYCSRAAAGVDEAEVSRIVEAAQRRNLARGITGVLVFGSGVFFQWIEGPAVQMQKLITNLRSDPRHYDIVVLVVLSRQAQSRIGSIGEASFTLSATTVDGPKSRIVGPTVGSTNGISARRRPPARLR